MQRRFTLLVLFAAILGLLGQEVVFAHAFPIASVKQVTGAGAREMSADCAEKMGLAKPQPQSPGRPCEGKSLDCMAKMGCAVPVAMVPSMLTNEDPQPARAVPAARAIATLSSLTFGPEPEPPTTFA